MLNPLRFSLLHTDTNSAARAGILELPHARVETPVFMPVGTRATVKGMTPEELEDLNYGLILGNTYHLHLRPGSEAIARAGGLHRFQGWDGALLTDSGGFQVFSLSGLRKIDNDGVDFQSHIDGSSHRFDPESVMMIQRNLGADIIMAFDECAPNPCTREYAQAAMDRTHRWARSCAEVWDRNDRLAHGGWPQALFGIVQGSVFEDLRRESVHTLSGLNLPGYAVGGLAVGEAADERNATIEVCAELLPKVKPRYLMGVGTPIDILDSIQRGIDMFDCVLPTRNARNAQVYTAQGVLNLRNARFADDLSPIDSDCDCRVCKRHTRAYIRHLFSVKEMLGPMLTTYHNLAFYRRLVADARSAILEDRFVRFRGDFVRRIELGDGEM